MFYIFGVITGLIIALLLFIFSKKDPIQKAEKIIEKVEKKINPKKEKAIFIKPVPQENVELLDKEGINIHNNLEDEDDI